MAAYVCEWIVQISVIYQDCRQPVLSGSEIKMNLGMELKLAKYKGDSYFVICHFISSITKVTTGCKRQDAAHSRTHALSTKKLKLLMYDIRERHLAHHDPKRGGEQYKRLSLIEWRWGLVGRKMKWVHCSECIYLIKNPYTVKQGGTTERLTATLEVIIAYKFFLASLFPLSIKCR